MGPFPHSFGNMYILLAVDYLSKWVEAIATQKNDAKTVVQFVHKNIFTRFGTPVVLSVIKGAISVIEFLLHCLTNVMCDK